MGMLRSRKPKTERLDEFLFQINSNFHALDGTLKQAKALAEVLDKQPGARGYLTEMATRLGDMHSRLVGLRMEILSRGLKTLEDGTL